MALEFSCRRIIGESVQQYVHLMSFPPAEYEDLFYFFTLASGVCASARLDVQYVETSTHLPGMYLCM